MCRARLALAVDAWYSPTWQGHEARRHRPEYKAVGRGRTFAGADRALLSPQVGSARGFRDGPKPPHLRARTCGGRHTEDDRDHNAARRVLFEGRRSVAAERTETRNVLRSAGGASAKAKAQRGEAAGLRTGRAIQAGFPGRAAGEHTKA
ncbi:hypothetical protein [Streptomyces chartreusis]|uniref:hypothetical protein n=1 Tax=Streptomyces chartreusis TaxID=1969 RepID=UPI003639D6DC